MESWEDSTPKYLLTQLIILKSEWTVFGTHCVLTIIKHRVLPASIHDKGQCSCPCCLMPLNKVHNLGTIIAMTQWQALACVDNQDCQIHLSMSRTMQWIMTILKGESFIAMEVCYWKLFLGHQCWLQFQSEHIFQKAWPLQIQFFCNVHDWFNAWVWTRGLEDLVHSSASNFQCSKP